MRATTLAIADYAYSHTVNSDHELRAIYHVIAELPQSHTDQDNLLPKWDVFLIYTINAHSINMLTKFYEFMTA